MAGSAKDSRPPDALVSKGVWFWLPSQAGPLKRQSLKNEAQAFFLAEKIRDFFDCQLGLGVWVEGKPGEQILSMALAGKKRETFSHRIGGFIESLPDRVAVMALDWLRRQLLQDENSGGWREGRR